MFKPGDIAIVNLPEIANCIPVSSNWGNNLNPTGDYVYHGEVYILSELRPGGRLHHSGALLATKGWIAQKYLIKVCKDKDGGIYLLHGRQRQPTEG